MIDDLSGEVPAITSIEITLEHAQRFLSSLHPVGFHGPIDSHTRFLIEGITGYYTPTGFYYNASDEDVAAFHALSAALRGIADQIDKMSTWGRKETFSGDKNGN